MKSLLTENELIEYEKMIKYLEKIKLKKMGDIDLSSGSFLAFWDYCRENGLLKES